MIVSVLALIVLSEPLRLRADVLGQARDPAGVLVLQGQGTVTDALTIDVLVWGNASESTRADILVGALRYRDPAGHGELTAGRMLLTSGGLLPLHLDGLRVFGRAPSNEELAVAKTFLAEQAKRIDPKRSGSAAGGTLPIPPGSVGLSVVGRNPQSDSQFLASMELVQVRHRPEEYHVYDAGV
mgnify:CR=1 FL=1